MHDSATTRTTAEALPDIIRWYTDNGYAFLTVAEALAAKMGKLAPVTATFQSSVPAAPRQQTSTASQSQPAPPVTNHPAARIATKVHTARHSDTQDAQQLAPAGAAVRCPAAPGMHGIAADLVPVLARVAVGLIRDAVQRKLRVHSLFGQG